MSFSLLPSQAHYTVAFLIDRAWSLRARCASCHHAKTWFSADLSALPPAASLGAIAEKLVCAMCGSAEGIIDVLNDTSESARRNFARHEAEQKPRR